MEIRIDAGGNGLFHCRIVIALLKKIHPNISLSKILLFYDLMLVPDRCVNPIVSQNHKISTRFFGPGKKRPAALAKFPPPFRETALLIGIGDRKHMLLYNILCQIRNYRTMKGMGFMSGNNNQVVLLTGASSGIGKATAEWLMERGFRVYGTSRKAAAENAGRPDKTSASGGFVAMIPLDVTSEESVENAVRTVLEREGRIDVLVSNAGMGIAGSIEDTSLGEAQEQFDVNFFGTLRTIRHVLPVMRKQGRGRIIVVSSVAGLISIPFQSMYSASKYALEALVEALRHEVAPFGIKACLVEPGDTRTGFTSSRVIAEAAGEDSPYYARFRKSLGRMEHDEQNGAPPEKVARAIHGMIMRKNPPIRRAVGPGYKTILFLKRLLPSRLVEKLVGMLYA